MVQRNARVLLVIGGGIAAYKTLELIRRLREQGVGVRAILTKGGAQFVTPLSVASLTGDKVYQDLWSLTDEAEMGHIRLSREADLVLVAPCTADLMAKMAGGHGDDLASTALLATDKPVLIAPAMNPRMWAHPATQRNLAQLVEDGLGVIGPEAGDMACGEVGPGRMAEPARLLAAITARLFPAPTPLAGRRAIVTSGPTHEPLDPVRYIANRSSGRQGHAIAAALAEAGAEVTLVTGPVQLPDPARVVVHRVERAEEMAAAVTSALPADIAVCAAAVADWRPAEAASGKLKKTADAAPPTLQLVPNPDILASLAAPGALRPRLVVGFAAETDDVEANAHIKLRRKGCDWLLANDVSSASGTFGGGKNTILLLTRDGGREAWPELDKREVARRLVARIAAEFDTRPVLQ
ncbi:MAG: bifunctional phosphopantothenoylcysteine decarboxylase/phosphopantothenate--cysteine ligase CoaBC [Geminicoccaceae bacterium]|nr:MAG: bifunctional phosphopantothenoylcysteine decarboxylase/phosphopantothenate--cysteine ligase CoaBC [Geminicoccaceae bacterium]